MSSGGRFSFSLLAMRHPARLTALGLTVGAALITVMALYFRRRRRRPYKNLTSYDKREELRNTRKTGTVHPLTLKSPGSENSTVPTIVRRSATGLTNRSPSSTPSSSQQLTRSQSTASNSTTATNETLTNNGTGGGGGTGEGSLAGSIMSETINYDEHSPQELCNIGLESMQTATKCWKEALDRLPANPENTSLSSQLHYLLERCEHLVMQYEQRISLTMQTNIAIDSAVDALSQMNAAYSDAMSGGSLRSSSKHFSSMEGDSDIDSFVSALDLADLSDLESQLDAYTQYDLYEEGLKELEAGNIQCRSLRTSMVNCASDTEFLAKLYCVRRAFNKLFEDSTIRQWFACTSRDMIALILDKADTDPDDFMIAYDEMLKYVQDTDNKATIEAELTGRGVKEFGFYDVVIDFMMFDAFDDLEQPPTSITAVIQNRWLSSGFKKTALSTAVWSVLKAKKQLLKVPHGFMAHFYGITEHTTPVLAWGFLGPEGPLKTLCLFFKEQVQQFMQDVFSFEKVHYTQLPILSDDILALAKDRLVTTQQFITNMNV